MVGEQITLAVTAIREKTCKCSNLNKKFHAPPAKYWLRPWTTTFR